MKKLALLTLLLSALLLTGCTFNRDEIDTEPPIITVNAYEEIIYIDEVIPYISATCIDDVDEVCVVTTPNYPDLSVHGSHTVTFRAEDSSGNFVIETVEIQSIDRAEYITITIEEYPNIIELGEPYVFPTITCVSSISNICEITLPTTINTDVVNPEVVYFITGTDDLGNSRVLEISVAVVDTTNPVITLTGDEVVNVELGNEWTDPGVETTDLQTVEVSQDITPNLTVVGEYVITYTATDSSGNTATVSRTVNVVDTTNPVITLTGDEVVNVELGNEWTDPGVETTDLQTVEVSQDITPNLTIVGEYVITYTATDSSGNTATVSRTVNVVDTTNPVITLTGDATVNLNANDPWNDPGATATDLQNVVITSVVLGPNLETEMDTSIIGTWIITYTATDESLNTDTTTRTIIIS